jgi:hypothetical protein
MPFTAPIFMKFILAECADCLYQTPSTLGEKNRERGKISFTPFSKE